MLPPGWRPDRPPVPDRPSEEPPPSCSARRGFLISRGGTRRAVACRSARRCGMAALG